MEKRRRKILGITGIRSEYDIASSVYSAIQAHPDLELELIVTGTHLAPAYGNTIQEIRKDGFKIVEVVESLVNGDLVSSRVKGLGIQLQGLVQAVARVRPDIIFVVGDREEAMTTALIGAYMNIPVAHLAGGDRGIGNVDDQVRHAVTKLVHLHFVTNVESEQRILRLGEQSFRIFNYGNPGLDRLLHEETLNAAELSKHLGFEIGEDERFVLIIQHPLSTEVDQSYFQMKQTLEGVKTIGVKGIVIYPNSDAGSHEMIRAIAEYEREPNLYISKNIDRVCFVNIMRRTGCLLGNSSAGILEAPILKIPVLNVGNRQKGRLHAENVEFISHDAKVIAAAIKKALFDESYRARAKACSNPYGDGNTGKRIAKQLAEVALNSELLIKEITY